MTTTGWSSTTARRLSTLRCIGAVESDRVIVEVFQFMLEGGAFYSDLYVRTPEGWRVAHTGYRRTFEATYNLGALPGFKLSGPGVHTHK